MCRTNTNEICLMNPNFVSSLELNIIPQIMTSVNRLTSKAIPSVLILWSLSRISPLMFLFMGLGMLGLGLSHKRAFRMTLYLALFVGSLTRVPIHVLPDPVQPALSRDHPLILRFLQNLPRSFGHIPVLPSPCPVAVSGADRGCRQV